MQKRQDGDLKLYAMSGELDPIVRPSSSSLPICPKDQVFAKGHGHYGAAADPWLAIHVRDNWIIPNTEDLLESL